MSLEKGNKSIFVLDNYKHSIRGYAHGNQRQHSR